MATTRVHHILKGLKKINWLAATLSGFILLFITISIFIDVFLRYFFNSPSIWITEVSTYLFLYIIFLVCAKSLFAISKNTAENGLSCRERQSIDRHACSLG